MSSNDRLRAYGIVCVTLILIGLLAYVAFQPMNTKIEPAKDQIRINGVVDQQKELGDK